MLATVAHFLAVMCLISGMLFFCWTPQNSGTQFLLSSVWASRLTTGISWSCPCPGDMAADFLLLLRLPSYLPVLEPSPVWAGWLAMSLMLLQVLYYHNTLYLKQNIYRSTYYAVTQIFISTSIAHNNRVLDILFSFTIGNMIVQGHGYTFTSYLLLICNNL